MKPVRLLPLTLCFALILLAFVSTAAAQDEPAPPEPKGLRPDAPPYALRGPHPVGVREFLIEAVSQLLPAESR